MKNFNCGLRSFLILCLIGLCFGVQAQKQQKTPPRGHALYKLSKIYDSRANDGKPKSKKDRALDRVKFEFEKTKDPNTGRIPDQIRNKEIQFSTGIENAVDLKKSVNVQQKSSNAPIFSYWKNRGPFNVGGRTRALAIDRTNENILLAGGVSGGLWRSLNQGRSWRKVTNSKQSPSITTIVQDPRPGKERVWYYGSGELISNSAGAVSDTGNGFVDAPFYGSGIYKSYNGGRSFELLESTDDGDITKKSPFDMVSRLAIHPVSGDLYVATTEGIFVSRDEGDSFQQVLPSVGLNATEVTIAQDGKIYATIPSKNKEEFGIFVSEDGELWDKISNETFRPDMTRTLIAVDPQQENIVYFFRGDNKLFKFDASLESEDAWIDLSRNLPNDLDTQNSYNMTLKVHPTNSNIVFVGGTNLYRSVTAFTDADEVITTIGGYSPGTSNNNGQSPLIPSGFYNFHHADQHELLFFASDSNKALSGNDGGVYITRDITKTEVNENGETVEWTSLNNGYLTTQPYSVSFDPNSNKEEVLAGFQDNGTWYTSSSNLTTPWEEDLGADGGYSAIADNGKTRYVSFQYGGIFRLNFDDDGNYISFSAISPEGSLNLFSFITPFLLDPNNDNVMYLPENNQIWVNRDLDALPTIGFRASNVNWELIKNNELNFSDRISALDVSKYPKANVLYYGTKTGKIFKINNALLNDQSAEDIYTGKGLPEGGYINDITVDPSNSDRVIVVYSSYGIPSLFLTDNGGESWTNISGNLEENADGSGSGPSVRCAGFFGSGTNFLEKRRQRIFVGTSTGLYQGRFVDENTNWRKENFKIGNKVVEELAVRKDGFIAVASHGNGVISARFPIFDSIPESKLKIAYPLENRLVNKAKTKTILNIKDLFVHEDNSPISISAFNSNSELVSVKLEGDSLIISHPNGKIGKTFIGLTATAGIERVSEGFELEFTDSIEIQNEPVIWGVNSQNFLDFGFTVQASDDFVVPTGQTWTIEKINALGESVGKNRFVQIDNATLVIYKDQDGRPSEEVYNSGFATVSQDSQQVLSLELPKPKVLESGKYWLSFYVNLEYTEDENTWLWLSQPGGKGNETHFRDEFDAFGAGALDWTPYTQANPEANGGEVLDQIFQIFGGVQTDEDETTKNPETTGNNLLVTVFPNPSSGKFKVNFKNTSKNENAIIRVYDITGRLLLEETKFNTNDDFVWDASSQTTGFYFVKIKTEMSQLTYKVLKK